MKDTNTNIVVETNDTPKVVEKTQAPVFHSEVEKFFVSEILKVNLNEATKELDNRIVIQHKDFATNIPCFNAKAKRVLVRDDNGERIVINNRDEIKKQQLKNRMMEQKQNPSQVITSSDVDDGNEVVFDD